MGVLNVTPDSFSDGGAYPNAQAAIDAALKMVDDGAHLIDIGGESTRPGAIAVLEHIELQRTLPIIEALAKQGVRISIDTMKAEVARQAVAAGASMVNDISGLRSPAMRAICAGLGCEVVIMHMQGEPTTMQTAPTYQYAPDEIRTYLEAQAALAQQEGIEQDKIWIDPGIGFGKTDTHNWQILANLQNLIETDYPVVLGISRKGFLGRVIGSDRPIDDRLDAALAIQALAQEMKVRMIRTHDVAATRRQVQATAALLAAEGR